MDRGPLNATYRVTEALPKDVGRGLARLDPKDMAELGVEIGDVVEVISKQTTVARVMPAHAELRGKRSIQIDGISRANAGAGLGEPVAVRRATAKKATTIVLASTDAPARAARGLEGRYLTRLLDGIPMVTGDRLRVNPIGTQMHNFVVTKAVPAGPVIVTPATSITCEGGAERRSDAVTYEDIGGLHKEMRRVREIIELPLKYPEVFAHLGIEAPKGVLLYGPPGTGKTLIARAVAHEANVHFIHVNGPEIIDKLYGASEAHLRKLFDEAEKNAPSIIFIDEIDAIAPKREEMGGERQVERRVVAQLLALMDGLEARGQVIIVAATNIPNTLDPALRRPGRFDREIEIGVPDKEGRREALEIHSRGMPLADAVNLERLAAITHGFVGADLAALCREAAMSALRRLMPDIDFKTTEIPYDKMAALKVEWADFESALAEVEPSALREVAIEVSDVHWDDVGGMEEVKRLLSEVVLWQLRYDNLFQQAGVRAPKGVLLHGAPGTGKTLLAKALAGETEANFIAVKGPQLLSMWIGESERGVREIFRKARQAAPCIVFFDEIDALAPRRGDGGGGQVAERVVAQLLTELDGIEDLKGVVLLAATNRLDRLDPALLRPGRLEFHIELSMPDAAARLAILQVHMKRMPLGKDVKIEALVQATEGFVGADLEGLCRQAALFAIREILEPAARTSRAKEGAVADRTMEHLQELTIIKRHFDMALADRPCHKGAGMSRVYLYAIVPAAERLPVEVAGVWPAAPQVRIVRGDALAAVIGAAPPTDFRGMSRADSVHYLLAHQRVVETVMRNSAALPVKFGTTLPDEAAVVGMLKRGGTILASPLAELSQYVQVELIVSWNIDDIVRECAADDVVVRFKAQIAAQPGGASNDQCLAIGKVVKDFVDRRREHCRNRIVTTVRSFAADVVENALTDERMIANLALLLTKEAGDALDEQLSDLDKEFGERLHFRCIGPLPPYSFATVEVSLPSFEAVDGARRALSLGESADLAEIKSAYHRQIRQVHSDVTAAAFCEGGNAAELTDAYKTLMTYAEALPSAPGDTTAGGTGYCFDRGTVEGAIWVSVRRQDVTAALAAARS